MKKKETKSKKASTDLGRTKLKGSRILWILVPTLFVGIAVTIWVYRHLSTAAVMVTGDIPLHYPGFQTFDTPRTFDNPGMVFRVDRNKIKYPVVAMKVQVTNAGQEAVPAVNYHTEWSFSGLLRFLGNKTAELSVDENSTIVLTVDLGHGTRFRTFDAEIDRALIETDIPWRKDSRYFVIRETIAFKEIRYKVEATGKLSTQMQDALHKVANGKGQMGNIESNGAELQQDLEQLHNVFYTADELIPPSSGLLSSSVKRIPIKEKIVINKEVQQPEGGVP